MTKLYRIAKSVQIKDLTGEGARLYGGRWNAKSVPVIYTSASLSLAALEYLAHLPMALAPPDLRYRTFTVPDDVKISRVRRSSLPADWKAMPFQDETAQIGTRWAKAGRTLLLRVPSVMVPDEDNYLINPLHPDFRRIKTGRPQPFRFDERILERRSGKP